MHLSLLLAVFASTPALSAELSLEDLRRGSLRASGIIRACESEPSACAEPATRSALARAFYTVTLDSVVHGRSIDPQMVANVRHLDATLYARLPSQGRSEGTPAPWVERLTSVPTEPAAPAAVVRASPPPEPEPLAEALPEPEPLPSDLPTALSFLRSGDLSEASRRLLALSAGGDREALLNLSAASERMALPATALLLEIDWLTGAQTDPRSPDVSRHAVRLATALGSRLQLTELAARLHPSRWAKDVQSEAWLARGQDWQARGDLSPALKAYSEIDPHSQAYVEGEYRTGLIYWQTAQPWEAIGAFRNAWEADSDNPGQERLREMALWRTARLYEELQRGPEAITRYEALAITTSPLSDRAAHRCAWVAVGLQYAGLADRWLAPTLPRGVFRADDDLLRAELALIEGRKREAAKRLDSAEPALRSLDRALSQLLNGTGSLWTQLTASDRDPVLAARLDADPELADYRALLAALRADRRRLAAHPDVAWRAEVGTALDRRLLDEELRVRSQAEATAAAAVIDVQRELAELARRAARLRKQVEG